jgi:hypothetical protein
VALTIRIILVVLILLGAAALIGSYTFLPPSLGAMVGRGVQRDVGLADTPNVELKSQPPPNMLAGKFSQGRIDMGEFDLGGGVRLNRVTIDLDPFDVDVIGSVTSGALKSEKPLSGDMRAELSEKAVTDIARSRIKQFPVKGVDLEKDSVRVSSQIELLGLAVPVSVEGGLKARDNALTFEPRSERAFGVPIPKGITDSLLAGTDFTYPLDGLPYDTQITGVELQKDRMILTGKAKRISLGGSGS